MTGNSITSFTSGAVGSWQRRTKSAPLDQATTQRYLRQVKWLRLILPALLFAVSTGFEAYEHWGLISLFDLQLIGEIFFFGLLGPAMVS